MADNLEAQLAEARASVAKLEEKNKELQVEKQKARQEADAAEQAREEAAERAEREAKDVEALEKRLSTKFQKDLTAITAERDKLTADLRAIRVDSELTRALASGNLLDGMSEVLEGYLKAKVDKDYTDGVATIAGQPIGEYVAGFLGSEAGASFRRASDNSGAGAAGSLTKPPVQHGFTKENFNEKQGEWMVLCGRDPVTAKQAAIDSGRPDLAATL